MMINIFIISNLRVQMVWNKFSLVKEIWSLCGFNLWLDCKVKSFIFCDKNYREKRKLTKMMELALEGPTWNSEISFGFWNQFHRLLLSL